MALLLLGPQPLGAWCSGREEKEEQSQQKGTARREDSGRRVQAGGGRGGAGTLEPCLARTSHSPLVRAISSLMGHLNSSESRRGKGDRSQGATPDTQGHTPHGPQWLPEVGTCQSGHGGCGARACVDGRPTLPKKSQGSGTRSSRAFKGHVTQLWGSRPRQPWSCRAGRAQQGSAGPGQDASAHWAAWWYAGGGWP